MRQRIRERPTLAACLVVVLSAAATASPAWGQSPADDAEALIRQGIELRQHQQDARALPLFERAYRLARNPRTAAQLGLVKMALGYWSDADRLLTEALAAPDHPWIAQNSRTLEETRASARKNIGEIVVVGGPAGAEILINGNPAGTLPLAQPIRLDKGTVEIALRAPGYTPEARSLAIAGGAQETVSMTLEPSAPRSERAQQPAAGAEAAAAGSATMVAVAESPGGRGRATALRVTAWISAAAALAGLTLGIVETVVATNKTDEFNGHTIASPTADDPNRRVPDCATDQLSDACRSIRDARDQAKTVAIVGYVAGGVLALASGALFVLSSRRAHEAEGPRTALSCAPLLPTAGVTCRLSF